MEFVKNCAVCGKEFTSIRRNATYCSEECKRKAEGLRAKYKHTKTCAVCGEVFHSVHEETLVCSSHCARIARHMGLYTVRRPEFMKKYHSESLDRKAKEWGKDYGKYQAQETLKMVGRVKV